MRQNDISGIFTIILSGSKVAVRKVARLEVNDLSRPPRGVITPPQFSCDTPNHLKFKGGYQGGVYGGVYVIVMEGVKY